MRSLFQYQGRLGGLGEALKRAIASQQGEPRATPVTPPVVALVAHAAEEEMDIARMEGEGGVSCRG